MIFRSPSVCNGRPRVRNTRIPVWLIIGMRKRGASDDQIIRQCPALTGDDLVAAREFYELHGAEVDRDVRAHTRQA